MELGASLELGFQWTGIFFGQGKELFPRLLFFQKCSKVFLGLRLRF